MLVLYLTHFWPVIPPEIPENQSYSGVSRGYETEKLVRNGLNILDFQINFIHIFQSNLSSISSKVSFFIEPTLAQCTISIPPENVRKPKVF